MPPKPAYLLPFVLAACQGEPPPVASPPAPAPAQPVAPAPVELSHAEGVAAADFDGDGIDDPVLITSGTATWLDQTQDLGGAFQATARGDIDGDGHEEALIASGVGRLDKEAPARVWALSARGALVLWENQGPRNQVTDLRVVGGRLFLAHFTDAERVEGGWLDGETLSVVGGAHMALRQLPLPDGGLVLGRLYGEQPRSDGDVRMRRGEVDAPLPSLRGARSLALGDLDGDGQGELIVGDGWHASYGTLAAPRVRLFRGPTFEEARTIAFLEGEYTARELVVLDPGPQARILATGTRGVHLLARDDLGWSDRLVTAVPETGNAVPVRTASGLAVLASGRPARIVPLPEHGPAIEEPVAH